LARAVVDCIVMLPNPCGSEVAVVMIEIQTKYIFETKSNKIKYLLLPACTCRVETYIHFTNSCFSSVKYSNSGTPVLRLWFALCIMITSRYCTCLGLIVYVSIVYHAQ